MLNNNNIADLVLQQKLFFRTGKTKEIAFRIDQLQHLKKLIVENQETIVAALQADLGKPKLEGILSEISYCIGEISYTINNLKSWAKPKKASVPLSSLFAKAKVISEPLGIVLIIGPWNYPFSLIIAPLIGAIAAGNCAIIKPSEIAIHTSNIVAQLIGKYFAPNFIATVEGDKEITQVLLTQKFDHIFFTGGTQIGKIIMEAAAKNLTPVTLELGGKSPCIVESDTHLEYTARRVTWGKFLNTGQTCIAPDYLLVNSRIKDDLVAAIKQCIQKFYGTHPIASPDYGRIISPRHFERLIKLLNSGEIVAGGETDANQRYIAPTVITGVNWDDEVMQEEIFGPILPVLEYDNLESAIAQINSRPKPLALYLFSTNKQTQEYVLKATSSGGVCINDTIMHLSSPELPFGGVGDSGIGQYHGKASFDTFSHQKSVLSQSFLFDFKLRYPPYEGKLNLLSLFLGLPKLGRNSRDRSQE